MMRPVTDNVIADPDMPCPCGSPQIGRNCCLDAQGVFCGIPAAVQPPKLTSSPGNPGCYAAPIGGCSSRLTGEHYISHAVLRRMTEGGGRLELSKFAWLPE